MGQKLAATNEAGDIIAFYDTVDSPAPDDASVVEITDDEWQACLANPGATVKRGKLVAPKPLTEAQQLAADQAQGCAQIDGVAHAAYTASGGHSPGRLAEYAQAASDAAAFKEDGYKGDVPGSVQCWAEAANLSARKAADSILARAARWDAAVLAIRAARLLGKAAVNGAGTRVKVKNATAKAVAAIEAAAADAE